MVDLMEIDRLLDYGCGHNRSLMETFKPERPCKVQCYDPGVPEFSGAPEPSEMVVCIDVMEHIEPDCLEDVLDHLEYLTEKVLYATVCTQLAVKKLPDGRNAHLIVQPYEWWLPKFIERFELHGFSKRGKKGDFEVICFAKDRRVRPVVEGD